MRLTDRVEIFYIEKIFLLYKFKQKALLLQGEFKNRLIILSLLEMCERLSS